MIKKNIPQKTIDRLAIYRRYLEYASEETAGRHFITSADLGKGTQVSAAAIRRDLSCMGQLGRRKIGYNIDRLCNSINSVLGLNKKWRVALVGAGNLGKALMMYRGFRKLGFEIVAVFDNARLKIGKKWLEIKIQDIRHIKDNVSNKRIEIAIIAVPFKVAQATADLLIESGIKAILNFAPIGLKVPDNIKLRSVDLATELANLSYFLTKKIR